MAITEELVKDCPLVVIMTDAQAILEAVKNDKISSLCRQIQSLAHCKHLVSQWITVHCEIPVNEKADELAKPGGNGAAK